MSELIVSYITCLRPTNFEILFACSARLTLRAKKMSGWQTREKRKSGGAEGRNDEMIPCLPHDGPVM